MLEQPKENNKCLIKKTCQNSMASVNDYMYYCVIKINLLFFKIKYFISELKSKLWKNLKCRLKIIILVTQVTKRNLFLTMLNFSIPPKYKRLV